MKNGLGKGLYLLVFSLMYVIFIKIFNSIFPELVYQFRYVVTGLYLFIYFIEGLRTEGESHSGLIQAFIGTLFGFIVSTYGIVQHYNGIDINEIYKLLEAWNLPFVGITSQFNLNIPGLIEPVAIQYLSIIILIVLSLLGSSIKNLIKKNKGVHK